MTDKSSVKRVQVTIHGDVQGVGYRYTAIEIARDLGLTGWTKNDPDGSVEIIAEGEKENLQNLITWAKKGPPLARIDRIEEEWQEATGEFDEFDVK